MPGLALRIRGQTAVHVNLQRHLMNSADASRMSRTAQACTPRGLMRTSTLGNMHDVRAETRGRCTTGPAQAAHCHSQHRNRLAAW